MKTNRFLYIFLFVGYLILILISCEKNGNIAENESVVKDFDGTPYQTVQICDKIWMKSNLNVSHYKNGDAIPEVSNPAQWTGLTTGAWCYYNNDPANGAIYGKLYNWYAVNDLRGLAPQGWHVPASTEWVASVTCLGGESVAGGKMKEAGTTHWLNPNFSATNSSDFTGLPGGYRCSCSSAAFYNIGNQSFWWSSSEISIGSPWALGLSYDNGIASNSGNQKIKGFSVRCVKN